MRGISIASLAVIAVSVAAGVNAEKPNFVVIYIDDLGYGGAQKQVSLLARHLPAPYRAVVISMSETVDPFARILEAAGVDVVTLCGWMRALDPLGHGPV